MKIAKSNSHYSDSELLKIDISAKILNVIQKFVVVSTQKLDGGREDI